MREHENCPSCTCGKIFVEWSDRSGYVDPTNSEDVVEMVLSCTLDHSYDRTETGIPYGMPDEIAVKLSPVIAQFFEEVYPKWKNETAYLTDEQREELKVRLLDALRAERKGTT